MIFARAVVLDLDIGYDVYGRAFLCFKKRRRGGTMVGSEGETRVMEVEEE